LVLVVTVPAVTEGNRHRRNQILDLAESEGNHHHRNQILDLVKSEGNRHQQRQILGLAKSSLTPNPGYPQFLGPETF